MPTLMKCGCRAMAHDSKTDKEICLTHMCEELMELPSLTNRMAKCMYCKKEVGSRIELPFFVYESTKDRDQFYCGCMGWE